MAIEKKKRDVETGDEPEATQGILLERHSVARQPHIGFQEFVSGSSIDAVLLAGARIAIQQDGQPRKRTREEWEQAVTRFASSPTS